jgi:hypothetical protein
LLNGSIPKWLTSLKTHMDFERSYDTPMVILHKRFHKGIAANLFKTPYGLVDG